MSDNIKVPLCDTVRLPFAYFTLMGCAFSGVLFPVVEYLTCPMARKLIAVRDKYGIRPLCIGKLQDNVIFASESCAFETIGATFERDVRPGEIVIVTELVVWKIAPLASSLSLNSFALVMLPLCDTVRLPFAYFTLMGCAFSGIISSI